MKTKNIQALIIFLAYIQYKLNVFCPELDEYVSDGLENQKKFKKLSSEIKVIKFNDKFTFRLKKPRCGRCGSTKHSISGYKSRILYILNEGKEKCNITTYECKNCHYLYYTDISSFVNDGSMVTQPVIDAVVENYSIFESSVRNIRDYFFKFHKVCISRQTIENILMNFKYDNSYKYGRCSGYYIFDALWVKENGTWFFLLALFDVKLNTIISYEIVEKEDPDTIRNFLSEATYNKNRIAITSDLKKEYMEPIRKLGFKQHFCSFHTSLKINRNIRDYIKKNKVSDDEMEKIKHYRRLILDIINNEPTEGGEHVGINNLKRRCKLIYDSGFECVFMNDNGAVSNLFLPSTNRKVIKE